MSLLGWKRAHRIGAALVGLLLRLFFIWRFPFEAGDTRVYEELARNWLGHGTYGLWVQGQLLPVDIRVPGYPAFLAAIYLLTGRSGVAARPAVMITQGLVDLAACFLVAALAARLAPESSRRRVASAGAWLAALCPFTANYAAVLLTEAVAGFLTALALLLFAGALAAEGSAQPRNRQWFLAGFVAGLGTLVRPETPLLLVAVALALATRWWRPADWRKLARAGLYLAAGFVLPLGPWAARNVRTLGRVQFLAQRYAQLPGEFVPEGFFAWTKTWLVSYREVELVFWRFEDQPIPMESLPASAFDSPEERARVAALLERYNEMLSVTPDVDYEFAQLARARTARHPLRTYLRVPLRRVLTMWLTPRTELLPYSGELWPLAERWEEDPVDFVVRLTFGLLNVLYVGLALVGAWRCRHSPVLALPVAFIVVRTLFFTQIETPEPRYVLLCFPALFALAALVWARPETEAPGRA